LVVEVVLDDGVPAEGEVGGVVVLVGDVVADAEIVLVVVEVVAEVGLSGEVHPVGGVSEPD
jgi:hypothetical protein